MAAVLLAAGAKGKRYALPNSRIMIHQGSGGFRGNTPDVFIQVKELEDAQQRACTRSSPSTPARPVEKIAKDTERDYFMSPEQAKAYGIIDEVIRRARRLAHRDRRRTSAAKSAATRRAAED